MGSNSIERNWYIVSTNIQIWCDNVEVSFYFFMLELNTLRLITTL